jgi:hemolysin activation/secretion protein
MRSSRDRAAYLAPLLLVALLLPVSNAYGQGRVRPGDERPELGPFAPELPPPGPLELPPIPPPEAVEPGQLSTGLGVFVESFHVEGSSVFSAEELSALTAPYRGREINTEELLRARDAISDHYTEHGYLTSGAVIPDQTVRDGIVTIQVIEGVLTDVVVAGNRRFRPGYFRSRLRWAGRAPVDVFEIEARLQRLQRDPRINRVRARLLPGERRGESVLHLAVEENRFYGLDLAFANDNSPRIGSYTGYVEPRVANLIGYGDELRGSFQISEGLREYDSTLQIPLPPFDTNVALHYQYSASDVVEEPFDALDIRSETATYGIALSQPFYPTRSQELRLGVSAEYRTSKTFLFDECFAFVPETASCKMQVSVLRLFGDWTWATRRNVVAARSMLSLGVHALGSTDRPGGLPDSEFVAWLGQAQWAHRLPELLLRSEVITRLDVQLANDVLPGIEKFSVGGMRTVRGYRENEFVRDNGLVASFELRVPVWRDRHGSAMIQLAPFVDYGRSWNEQSNDPETLASAGVGLLLSPLKWLRGEIYWGGRLKSVPKAGGDLQDHGVNFSLTVTAF